jgi:hypothetical protein
MSAEARGSLFPLAKDAVAAFMSMVIGEGPASAGRAA